jgi:hypothetical protein
MNINPTPDDHPKAAALINEWRAAFQKLSWQEKRDLLAKHGADDLLSKGWATADSFEERWMDLEAIAHAVRDMQEEIEISMGASE